MKVHDSIRSRPVNPARRQQVRLKTAETILFARGLSGLLNGGVPILTALHGLESASAGENLRVFVNSVANQVKRGISLSEAIRSTGSTPAFLHQSLYSGEVSGRVADVLGEAADYIEKDQQLKRRVIEALIYPGFIMIVGFLTMTVLSCFILPKLGAVYEGFDKALPLTTIIILFLGRAFIPIAVLTSLTGAALIMFIHKKGKLDAALRRIPIIADMRKSLSRVRFTGLMNLLLESGLPALQALDVAEKALSSRWLTADFTSIKRALATGSGFSEALKPESWMDPMSWMILSSGEEAGRVSEAFGRIAATSEASLESRLQFALKLLEPGLILIIGLTVGIIVIAAILPIFDISGLMK